jgi:hypothetical protein
LGVIIALLAAGIFSVVVRGHFCLSKSLVSREISEVSSLFHSLPRSLLLPYLLFGLFGLIFSLLLLAL